MNRESGTSIDSSNCFPFRLGLASFPIENRDEERFNGSIRLCLRSFGNFVVTAVWIEEFYGSYVDC